MSRRKQSIPCKVQGMTSAQLQGNSETSLDIVKLHTMTDSLLNMEKGGHETNATTKGKSFSHSFAMKNYVEKNENTLNHTDKYSYGNGQAQSCGLDYSMSTLNSSQSRCQEDTQSRQSARLRARSGVSIGEGDQGYSPTKRKFSDPSGSNTWLMLDRLSVSGSPRALALTRRLMTGFEIDWSVADENGSQSNDNQPSFQPRERTRTVSSEEELMCPICHKGFMSKYGLLCHSEIHSTPELKCIPCDLKFSSRTGFVNHQMTVHQPRRNYRSVIPSTETTPQKPLHIPSKETALSTTKTYKVLSGFNDLSGIDFSCRQFPAISEGICSESLHRLTERDSHHFFLCKSCNYLYPTLSALQIHMVKYHESSSTRNNQTIFQEKLDLLKSPGKLVEFDSQKYPEILSLVPKDSNTVKVDGDNGNIPIQYGMDDGTVRTSPMVACLQVPRWMRESGTIDDAFDLFNVKTTEEASEDRPSLKMKIVRRREERENIIHVTNSDYYIYDEPGTKESKEKAMEKFDNAPYDPKSSKPVEKKCICKTCGGLYPSETALACHRLGSMCGIGFRTSSNGRKMFWCRLCNYTSFEKSTILRHQRTHTGVRPYTCRFCEIAFTTKANCERHIRKRHSSRVTTDIDVKNAVHCDHMLMKKAREGEIDISVTTKSHANRFFNTEASFTFHFECRLCEATFSSRGNGTRHVLAKHGIVGKKNAHEVIKYVEKSGKMKKKGETADLQKVSRPDPSVPTSTDEKRNSSQEKRIQPVINNLPSKMSRAAHIPKLIPLQKIKAYYEASTKMLTHFQRDYDEAVSFVSNNPDPEKFMSKVLSLLDSTSLEMKQHEPPENKPHSVFTPTDALSPYPSVFQSASRTRKENSPQRQETNTDMNREDYNSYGEGEDEDVAHRFADGEFNWDCGVTPDPSPLGDSNMQASPNDESSFKPWKNPSSSLMLRHFAANSQSQSIDGINKPEEKQHSKSTGELTSVTELIKFAQTSPVIPLPEKPNSTDGQNHFSLSEKAPSDGSESRGKYQMVVVKLKSDHTSGEKTQPSLAWKFIPEPPRTRDERGRYVRDPNSQSQNAKSYSSITPYKSNDNRPTMVSMQSKKFHLNVHHRKSMGLISSHGLKGRKCPKCDKTFPWASSLSRHIMTHTGFKPFMCARCSMRFTTRSNLLRHAYRRHGLQRGSEERHNMLVTLSVNEQKEYADQEAQKIVEMDEGSPALSLDMEDQVCENNFETEENMESNDKDASPSALEVSMSRQETVHYNKRYICGLCRLPFANRSNLVRHLHRLHHITKDYPDFKALLIKIRKKNLSPFPRHKTEEVPALDDIQEQTDYSPPPTMVNGLSETFLPLRKTPTPPTSSSPRAIMSSPGGTLPKTKPFTCAICFIGFTKRNNCARHIQHQHDIDRKNARLRSLIIRNEISLDSLEDPQKNDPVFDKPEESQISLTPPAPLLDSNVLEQNTNPSHQEKEYQEVVKTPMLLPMEETTMTQKERTQEEEEELREGRRASDESLSSAWKSRRRPSSRRKLDGESDMTVAPIEHDSKPPKKNIRLTQFVCGVCKRIFKTVAELKEHLDDHNIPHPWHCPLCDVPFTNKYNCQRHLLRRHGSDSAEPKYVEDVRHGPRMPRKRSKIYGR